MVSDIVAENLPDALLENRHLYSSCLTGAISESAYLDGLRKAGMTQVEVKDRLIYDALQIEAFIGSELKDTETSCCCGGEPVEAMLARRWAKELAGKVASIKVFAMKNN